MLRLYRRLCYVADRRAAAYHFDAGHEVYCSSFAIFSGTASRRLGHIADIFAYKRQPPSLPRAARHRFTIYRLPICVAQRYRSRLVTQHLSRAFIFLRREDGCQRKSACLSGRVLHVAFLSHDGRAIYISRSADFSEF